MACDLAVTSDLAIFGQAGPKHGSAPDGGSTDFLPWMFSIEDAMWNCISCEMWSAYKMKAKNLISKVVPVLKVDGKWVRNPMIITDEYVKDGELVGFDVELSRELARRLGVDVKFEIIDFRGIVAALKSGRVDILVTAMTQTPEREEQIGFSVPYYDAGIGAAFRISEKIERPEDLAGKVIGVELGSSGEHFVRTEIGDLVGEVVTYDSIVLALNDLENGRVDAVVNPLPAITFNSRNNEEIATSEVWVSRTVGVNTRLDDIEFRATINETLLDMEEDGFLPSLRVKWFEAE